MLYSIFDFNKLMTFLLWPDVKTIGVFRCWWVPSWSSSYSSWIYSYMCN